MKYSLAFLFVAATAILVTSAPPPSITVDTLNELLLAREYNQLRVDKTLAELQAEHRFVPRDFNELLKERERSKNELADILSRLEKARKKRAAAQKDNDAHKKVRMESNAEEIVSTSYGLPPNTLSPAEVGELDAKAFNAQALTVAELNELLAGLARNAAQRIQLACIATENCLPQDQIEELTHSSGWTYEELSEDKLCTLKKVLRFFVSPLQNAFLPILARAGLCALRSVDHKNYVVNYPENIIAEKIWDSHSQVLEYVLQLAEAAKLKYPTK